MKFKIEQFEMALCLKNELPNFHIIPLSLRKRNHFETEIIPLPKIRRIKTPYGVILRKTGNKVEIKFEASLEMKIKEFNYFLYEEKKPIKKKQEKFNKK